MIVDDGLFYAIVLLAIASTISFFVVAFATDKHLEKEDEN